MDRRTFNWIAAGALAETFLAPTRAMAAGAEAGQGGIVLLGAGGDDAGVARKHLVQTRRLNPRIYPDDRRRFVQPPDWAVFGHRAHFATLRHFEMRDGEIVDFSQDFDRYTDEFDLGDVIWPRVSFLRADNIPRMVEEMKRRKLFLFDVWGYVPGSGPRSIFPEFQLSPGLSSLFTSQLGDHWLGMDMGEQAGRYVLGFAASMTGISEDRIAQYLNFHRYMQGLTGELGDKMVGLNAITFPHYLAKEGIFTLLGGETAQEQPNAQVSYAFIRGAGTQYGVPWFGNASVYNRWGWKTYEEEGRQHGPTKGTSLSLLRRLIYSHILYNSMIVGFESGWIANNKLTPIGEIQQSAQKWVRANGDPGVMQTPVAIMLDFNAGWIDPSYDSVLYRVWGNLPYGPGDYLANNVLAMLYPGYQDSSFFHDETGFLTATPYGDAANVVLSDIGSAVLNQYSLLVVAGELAGGAEIRDKLQAFIEQGGQLYIAAGSLKNLEGGLAGIEVDPEFKAFPAGQVISFSGAEAVKERMPFELHTLRLSGDARVVASARRTPAVAAASAGKGRAVVFASAFGLPSVTATKGPVRRPVDKVLPNPYPMLRHVARVLDAAFRSQALFEAGDGLSLIACRRGPGDYVLGVGNNSLSPRPLEIVSHLGSIESVEEIPLDQSAKVAVGYLPEGFEDASIGKSNGETIAGADYRIFNVRVAEAPVVEMPAPAFEPPPRDLYLAVRNPVNLEDALLARPTFFQNFDGISLDWKYLLERERLELEREASWLNRQKVRILVDLSSGINLFPGFRLVDNYYVQYKRSLDGIFDVVGKMGSLNAHNLILTLHQDTGAISSGQSIWAEYANTLALICQKARAEDVTVYLRNAMGKMGTPDELLDLVERVALSNLKLAMDTGPMLDGRTSNPQVFRRLRGKVKLWLVSAARRDVAGRVWTTDAPLDGMEQEQALTQWLDLAPDVPIVANAVYRTKDEEYGDVRAIRRSLQACGA